MSLSAQKKASWPRLTIEQSACRTVADREIRRKAVAMSDFYVWNCLKPDALVVKRTRSKTPIFSKDPYQ